MDSKHFLKKISVGGIMEQIQTVSTMTMKHLTLSNITKACGGTLFLPENQNREQEQEEAEATQVVLDSRAIQPGGVFIATKGERVDGHDFIHQVLEKKAMAVICEQLPTVIEGPIILVNNSFQALKDLAEFYRKQLQIKVVGITGSVGKTSTKEFIAAVLEQEFQVLKTQGNFNNEVGLPLTVLSLRQHHQVAVLEMGISDFGEMHRLSKIAKPDIAVITNIGQCHLENLKDRDGVLQAKTEIFDYMPEHGLAILNGDDDKLETITLVKGKLPITFGRHIRHDFYAKHIEPMGLRGTACKIILKKEFIDVMIPLPGEHMVSNALCAAAVGTYLGVKKEEIKKGIESVKSLAGRSNLIQTDRFLLIDDCYNANPISMKAALDLVSLADTRKVAILGDMFELGDKEVAHHRDVARYALEKSLDIVIFIGTLSRNGYEEARYLLQDNRDLAQKQVDILFFQTKEELLSTIEQLLLPGDTILVKASHGMHFEELIKAFS
jgi:UDP-N-acetylmuramoyl-tripeptide--D-alanyl-D-alanine ligase